MVAYLCLPPGPPGHHQPSQALAQGRRSIGQQGLEGLEELEEGLEEGLEGLEEELDEELEELGELE